MGLHEIDLTNLFVELSKISNTTKADNEPEHFFFFFSRSSSEDNKPELE